MSTVLWCTLQNDPEDFYPDDLGCLFDQLDALDELCIKAGVTPISEFVDESDLQFNMSEQDLDEEWLRENARWFKPVDLLNSVEGLLNANLVKDPDLTEELQTVRERCVLGRDAGTKVRLLIVM